MYCRLIFTTAVLTRHFLNLRLETFCFNFCFELLFLHMTRPMLTQKRDIFEKQNIHPFYRRQRINLNLLVDHSREIFMQNIHQFVKQESSLITHQRSFSALLLVTFFASVYWVSMNCRLWDKVFFLSDQTRCVGKIQRLSTGEKLYYRAYGMIQSCESRSRILSDPWPFGRIRKNCPLGSF